ncbi:MAG TPA: KpsF/GutQ family sugar-phosphate isomerase [Candidatus Aminicenantes bacterium]|nr:KpsF/GutQ family sugar-phosphate isomerase [Candidatus Aminicenantes bacterium]
MDCLEIARHVLRTESKAIELAVQRLDSRFTEAVDLVFGARGRVVITGMGKSGLVGKKIAATLTSTGTPAVFLHPSEALHGDIGIIMEDDIVVALSTSGETLEVVRLINLIRRIGVKLIALVGREESTLARESDCFIDCSVENEACPIGLVPTTSTTLTLAMGDALAIALMEKKGFREENFRFNHPGGSIGKKLLKVAHLMHSGEAAPRVRPHDPMESVIREIDQKRFGVAVVADENDLVVGVITDGDLRRNLLRDPGLLQRRAVDCMTPNPLQVTEDRLAVEALKEMEDHRITSLVVTRGGRLAGLLHLHDLWRTEMF